MWRKAGNFLKFGIRPGFFLATFKCNDYKLISRFFFLVLSRSYFIFPRYFHGFTDFQLYYTDFDITGCSCNLLGSQQRNLFIINTLWRNYSVLIGRKSPELFRTLPEYGDIRRWPDIFEAFPSCGRSKTVPSAYLSNHPSSQCVVRGFK